MNAFLNTLPCTAVEHLSFSTRTVEDWMYLCGRTPNLKHLRLDQYTSDNYEFDSDDIMDLIPRPMFLTRVCIALEEGKAYFNFIESLIKVCQSSLQQFKLICAVSKPADGQSLETLLKPCRQLKKIEFQFQYTDTNVDMVELLRQFQSEWWLNDCRPPVLIERNDSGHIVIASMPCSSKTFLRLSTDLKMWLINKGKVDSSHIQFTKLEKLFFCNNNEQPVTLDFLHFIGRIFHSRHQEIEFRFWSFSSPHTLYEQVSFCLLRKIIHVNE